MTERANGRSKCYVLHVFCKNQSIGTATYKTHPSDVYQTKYLGVDLSNDLDWSHHTPAIITRTNKILGLLRRDLKSCLPSIKSTVYKTLVRPHSVE